MILSDVEIAAYAAAGMISPYEPSLVRKQVQHFILGGVETTATKAVISYGQSSYGYDMRVSREWKIFTNTWGALVDPKAFDPKAFVDHEGDSCIIPPNSFVLARSVERFQMPPDVLAICLGKSTYARCGIICNVTPLEPGWTGHLTIELSNTTPLPARIYSEEGIAQLIFLKGNPCHTTYADRAGKYQDQVGIVVAKV